MSDRTWIERFAALHGLKPADVEDVLRRWQDRGPISDLEFSVVFGQAVRDIFPGHPGIAADEVGLVVEQLRQLQRQPKKRAKHIRTDFETALGLAKLEGRKAPAQLDPGVREKLGSDSQLHPTEAAHARSWALAFVQAEQLKLVSRRGPHDSSVDAIDGASDALMSFRRVVLERVHPGPHNPILNPEAYLATVQRRKTADVAVDRKSNELPSHDTSTKPERPGWLPDTAPVASESATAEEIVLRREAQELLSAALRRVRDKLPQLVDKDFLRGRNKVRVERMIDAAVSDQPSTLGQLVRDSICEKEGPLPYGAVPEIEQELRRLDDNLLIGKTGLRAAIKKLRGLVQIELRLDARVAPAFAILGLGVPLTVSLSAGLANAASSLRRSLIRRRTIITLALVTIAIPFALLVRDLLFPVRTAPHSSIALDPRSEDSHATMQLDHTSPTSNRDYDSTINFPAAARSSTTSTSSGEPANAHAASNPLDNSICELIFPSTDPNTAVSTQPRLWAKLRTDIPIPFDAGHLACDYKLPRASEIGAAHVLDCQITCPSPTQDECYYSMESTLHACGSRPWRPYENKGVTVGGPLNGYYPADIGTEHLDSQTTTSTAMLASTSLLVRLTLPVAPDAAPNPRLLVWLTRFRETGLGDPPPQIRSSGHDASFCSFLSLGLSMTLVEPSGRHLLLHTLQDGANRAGIDLVHDGCRVEARQPGMAFACGFTGTNDLHEAANLRARVAECLRTEWFADDAIVSPFPFYGSGTAWQHDVHQYEFLVAITNRQWRSRGERIAYLFFGRRHRDQVGR